MTIHLFAEVHDKPPHLRRKRRSADPTPQPGETHIGTLHDQPELDKYTKMVKECTPMVLPSDAGPCGTAMPSKETLGQALSVLGT